MPPSKANVIEQLSEVKNLGSTYATRAYEDLGVRTIDDLIEAAKAGKLQSIKGVGAAKEKAILASAQDLQKASKPAPTPEKSAPKAKAKPAKKAPKAEKAAPKKAKAPKASAKKADAAKKEAPKAAAKKADAKKAEAPKAAAPKAEAPKAEAPKAEPKAAKADGAKAERPRTTYRPPQPKPRPSIPGLLFKLTKKIIGRILS